MNANPVEVKMHRNHLQIQTFIHLHSNIATKPEDTADSSSTQMQLSAEKVHNVPLLERNFNTASREAKLY